MTIHIPLWAPRAYVAIGLIFFVLDMWGAWKGVRRTTQIREKGGAYRDLTIRETARVMAADYAGPVIPVFIVVCVVAWPALVARYWWRSKEVRVL